MITSDGLRAGATNNLAPVEQLVRFGFLLGRWHSICIAYPGGKVNGTVYLDAIPLTPTFQLTDYAPDHPVQVRLGSESTRWVGDIGLTQLYDSALSQADIGSICVPSAVVNKSVLLEWSAFSVIPMSASQLVQLDYPGVCDQQNRTNGTDRQPPVVFR
jgi:hypothetical protein